MTEIVACSIVSKNYLAFARVWADSLRQHHPEIRPFVLLVDEPDPALDDSAEPFRVVLARDLEIPAFRHFAFKYSLLELNTAVKPYFLEHLQTQHDADAVLYFDPDIQIFASLGPLLTALESRNLLLTPHLLQPLEDDYRPSERNILMAGVYNLGFLGLRFNRQTLAFLRWWQRRLYTHCLHRIEEGLFVDQRWMDLAPCLLDDVEILRDPGYNVAYWNLAHRLLTREDGGWQVNGVPLRFFHFSGVAIDDLGRLSKYQDRFRLQDRPDLEPLFKEYRQAVLAAGWERTKTLPYAYGSFDNGIGIPDLGRAEIWRADFSGERWPNPFATEIADGYYSWLSQPVHSDGGDTWLPRIGLVLWEHRPDLQSAFPDPAGVDHENFVRWLLSDEPRAAGVDRELLRGLETPAPTAPRATRPVVDEAAERSLRQLAAASHIDAPGQPRIPRIALLIRDKRPDLQEAFPAPLGESRAAFARWLVTFGRCEYQLPADLWRPTLRSLPLSEQLRARIWSPLRRLRGGEIDVRGSWRDFVSAV